MMFKSALPAFAIFLLPILATAHHSDSSFDLDRVVAFQGTVMQFAWRNPHVYLVIADANDIEWLIETGATPILRRSGWNRDSFVPGDVVSVRSNPDRNPEKRHGLLLSIEGSDGVALASRQRSNESDISAIGANSTDLSGVWAGERFLRNAFWAALKDHPLTPKGNLAKDQYDDSMNPTASCIAAPSPWIVALADLHLGEIELREDTIVFRSEFIDVERVVYMDGRRHPEGGERTNQGHSIGSWEGDTLVVDTVLFADNRSPVPQIGRPSGAEKHVVERYTLTDDRTRLLIDIFLEDPEYLAEPITTKLVWHYSPHLELLAFDCDPEVAQRFLE